MRDVLLERVRPLIEGLAGELVELVLARIEAELARLPELFEVALSAFASEVDRDEHPDRRDHDPVPRVPSGAGRGLHRDEERRNDRAAPQQPAPASDARRAPRERAARLVEDTGRDRTALQANGKQPPTCKRCGYVGGNARGCGTAHETQTSPNRLASIASSARKFAERPRIAIDASPGMPRPSSSFRVTPPERAGEFGDVEELDLGGADQT